MTKLLELAGALGITSVLGIAAITSMSPAPGRADDVRARASLHAAVVTALGTAIDGSTNSELALDEVMSAAEPGLGWTTTDSTDGNVISVAARQGSVGLATRSLSGSCFVARVGPDGSVVFDELIEAHSCSGRSVLTAA
ncbi:MAG: hypothetical protein AB7V43_05515 [Acidimicrobiia bacterium]